MTFFDIREMVAYIKKGIISSKEIIFWTSALVVLFFSVNSHTHFTICPLALLDFSFCPGCGFGRSVAATMHGDIKTAFEIHPLGPIGFLILTYRIISLFINKIKLHAQNNEIAPGDQ